MVRLFEHELECDDPFFIAEEPLPTEASPADPPAVTTTGRRKTNNIYNSFINSAALDDIDALEDLAIAQESKPTQQFRKFAELPAKSIVAILMHLC